MEQTQIGVRHYDVVLIAGGNDARIVGRSSWTGNVRDAAQASTIDVVAEGEEGIRAECDATELLQPVDLLLCRQLFWRLVEPAKEPLMNTCLPLTNTHTVTYMLVNWESGISLPTVPFT